MPEFELKPNAVEVSYHLTIKACRLLQVAGDRGGLEIRFDADGTIASSFYKEAVRGADATAAKQAIQMCLEYLLKNIDSIQATAEANVMENTEAPHVVEFES